LDRHPVRNDIIKNDDYGERTMRLHLRTLVLGIVFAVVGPVALAAAAPPDEIANWNQMLFRMGLVAHLPGGHLARRGNRTGRGV